jgi:D-xylose 1-dehydrogenase (NADP+, D-xylono-1,5-lactone-forming)
MDRKLRFGILGTGNIAGQFAAGVAGCHRCQIVAVASRSQSSAKEFAGRHAAPAPPVPYGSYDQLLADPAVDAVYLSLPNTMHHQWALKALAAGKHVLCEKPIATSSPEAEEMFDAAQKAGRLLMEAFMYVSHPQTNAVLEAIRSGAIGSPRLIRASFCYRTNKIDGNIRFNRALAGGALMDVGCYCLHFSRLIMGTEPTSVHAVAQMHETGVDELTAGVLAFADGAAATFTCGMRVQADNTASICGTDGYIEIPIPWKPPVNAATFTIARSIPPKQDGLPTTASLPPRQTLTTNAPAPLYGMEADDFAAAALHGAAITVTPSNSLGNMRLLDQIRRQIGLDFSA